MATKKPAPSSKPLSAKLLLKAGTELNAINAPENYLTLLGPLPQGASVNMKVGSKPLFVHLFANNRAELERHFSTLVKKLTPDVMLWISYPKTAQKDRDLSRDVGWDMVHKAGWQGVSLVAVDDTWSAMRFRPIP